MVVENSLKRREILIRIIGTGINITPNALNVLSTAELSNKDIEELIRQVGFLPDFQSHITMDVLKKTKYNKYTASLSGSTVKTSKLPSSDLKREQESKTAPKEQSKNTSIQEKEKKKQFKSKSTNPVISSEKDTMNLLKGGPTEEKMIKEKPQDSNVKVESQDEAVNTKSLQYNPESSSIENVRREKKRELLKKAESMVKKSKTSIRKEHINKIKKNSLELRDVGGLTQFNPIAREHYEEIEILKDSSKNLYTTGSIEDFYDLMNDRFNRIKDILYRSNSDIAELMEIKQLLRQQDSLDVSFIAMVQEKSQVGELNHIKVKFEDPTGEITGLVLNKDRNQELYQQMIYLLEDHVVYVKGHLKIDRKKNSRAIFINELRWPDIPYGSIPKIDKCPVSFALISDLHMGSIDYQPKLLDKFIRFLRGEIGNQKQQELAGSIKYLLIDGDLVDGIGNYPDQDKELSITDIYEQFKYAAESLRGIPDYIKIIYIPGNHEPVRNALPQPAVDPKYCQDLVDMGVICLGNPSMVKLHGLKFLMYHGDSIFDMNISVPGLSNERPEITMREYLRCRHLAPIYGKKTGVAPTAVDHLVIDEVPHVFQTGHVHINGLAYYNNVLTVNTGTFQQQTGYMKSLGVDPTPGLPVIVDAKDGKVNATTINLNL